MSTTESIADQIESVLNDAEELTGSMVFEQQATEELDRESGAFLDLATDAAALLRSTDSTALLNAFDLESAPDGSDLSSVPEAIARGDPDHVAEFHRLVSLATFADTSADEFDTLDRSVRQLRETMDEATSESDSSSESRSQDAPDTDDTRSNLESDGDDGSVDSNSSDEAASSDSRSSDEDIVDETIDDVSDRLEAALQSPIDNFTSDVERFKKRLREVGDNVTDEIEARSLSGDKEELADISDDEPESETTEENGDESTADPESDSDSDSLFGDKFSSSDSGRLSTVAPGPSKRADMHAVPRYSTVRRTK